LRLHTGTGCDLAAVHAGGLDVGSHGWSRSRPVVLWFGYTAAGASLDPRECAILWRAHNRGEIDATTQHRPVIEALLGPLYFRLLVTGEPLDDRFVEGIVDLVCAACTVN
jgi:Tetracyclin repressor-like, C-terminal domain